MIRVCVWGGGHDKVKWRKSFEHGDSIQNIRGNIELVGTSTYDDKSKMHGEIKYFRKKFSEKGEGALGREYTISILFWTKVLFFYIRWFYTVASIYLLYKL